MPLRLSLCLHNHQPVGNFDQVIERAYESCYLPLLDCIDRHGGIRLGLHHSGCLLEWIGSRHVDYLERLSGLCRSGRVELLSSGYFEPLLPVFRRSDIRAQIGAFGTELERISGARPTGIWLTERVWEPSIPSLLAGTGVNWSVVDDSHLLLAGVPPSETGRPWMTEDGGWKLVLLGSSKALRYAIPFSSTTDVFDLLHGMERKGVQLAFYGDDGEKFGVWPGTADLCWRDGWVDRFFDGIEKSDWIEMLSPSEAIAAVPAGGPVYIPAASYAEMGEWSLPEEQQETLASLETDLDRQGLLEGVKPFLRGGFWRNFLSRYPEANELHKRVLLAEKTVKACASEEALKHFWRSQCNCPYWHGVFGGLYLPHLREAVWTELSEAERKSSPAGSLPRITAADIDFDGRQEVHVLTPSLSTLLRVGEGMTVSELTLLPVDRRPVPLGHTLTRRREPYHKGLPDDAGPGEGVRTIHASLPAVEEGLASRLVTDRYRRLSFRTLLLPRDGGRDCWLAVSPEVEAPEEVEGAPSAERLGGSVVMSGVLVHGSARIAKKVTVDLEKPAFEIRSVCSGLDGRRQGCEICLNLLTGSEPDRFVRIGSSDPVTTGRTGSGTCRELVVEDGWRKVRIRLRSQTALEVAHMPLDSVNRSERGYERVHQGMALLVMPASARAGTLEFRLELEAVR